MLPMPPVEERTIGVNEARSISRIRSSYSLFIMFLTVCAKIIKFTHHDAVSQLKRMAGSK